MKITIIDDSVPYDGNTPRTKPLGGVEKAVASLAPALAARGHDVSVVNRIETGAMIDGVTWAPIDGPLPPESDVVIAMRNPALFAGFEKAARKILWMATPAKVLNKPKNQAFMEKYNPIVAFMGDVHYRSWQPWKDFKKAIITPGIRGEYLNDSAYNPVTPPRAIVTSNPLHGLDGILKIWVNDIRPRVEDGELHLYSAGLYRAQNGLPVPEKLLPIFEQVRAVQDQGVIIQKPGSDFEMAMAYRNACVHLYPGVETEMYCSTLAESQAAGLPAVARPVGACSERVRNGQTGFLVPDTDAMANVTAHLMTNDGPRRNMSNDCRMMQRGRTWDLVAAEFEAFF